MSISSLVVISVVVVVSGTATGTRFFLTGIHRPSAHFLAPMAAASRARATPEIMPRIRPSGVSATIALAGMSLLLYWRTGLTTVSLTFLDLDLDL